MHWFFLIGAFASRLSILWLLSYWRNGTPFGVSKLKRRLLRLVRVYTCQNATLLKISRTGSNVIIDEPHKCNDQLYWAWKRFNNIEVWSELYLSFSGASLAYKNGTSKVEQRKCHFNTIWIYLESIPGSVIGCFCCSCCLVCVFLIKCFNACLAGDLCK